MELEILRAIQSIHCGFLDVFFQAITIMAEQYVMILALLAVYWLYDKELGEYVAYSLMTAMAFTNGVKNIFKLPRPIGEEGIRTLHAKTATGYSFPSGHSQISSSLAWSFAAWLKKRWIRIAAIVFTLLVAFSRLYLGVHYPKDVLVGLILGVGFSYLCLWLYKKIKNRVALYFVTSAVMLVFFLFEPSKDFIKSCGLLLGFAVAMLIDHKFLRYDIKVRFPIRLLRLALGLVAAGIVYLPMKLLLPDMLVFAFLRYFTLSVMVLGVYPITFRWIK